MWWPEGRAGAESDAEGSGRAELGREAFGQRQVSKTRAAEYGRHDLLVRMLAWMHATGATEYDAEAHLATEA